MAAVKAHLLAYLEREPTDGETRRRLARALIELNDSSEAYKQVQLAAKEDPTGGPAATAMGWIYTQKADLAKAAQWMEYSVNRRLRTRGHTWATPPGYSSTIGPRRPATSPRRPLV